MTQKPREVDFHVDVQTHPSGIESQPAVTVWYSNSFAHTVGPAIIEHALRDVSEKLATAIWDKHKDELLGLCDVAVVREATFRALTDIIRARLERP